MISSASLSSPEISSYLYGKDPYITWMQNLPHLPFKKPWSMQCTQQLVWNKSLLGSAHLSDHLHLYFIKINVVPFAIWQTKECIFQEIMVHLESTTTSLAVTTPTPGDQNFLKMNIYRHTHLLNKHYMNEGILIVDIRS